jgi:DNA-binding transcriptional regulator YdaS (Cro superfamily)
MDLKTYFKTNSQTEFARLIGVTAGAVNQWASGLTTVSAERCPQIEQVTQGLVRCEDLRPDVAWAVLRQSPATPTAATEGA